MGATTKDSLMSIYIISQDDTGEYQIGDVEGDFLTEKLNAYLKEHGPDKIYKHLNKLKVQVIDEMVLLAEEEEND